MRLLHLIDENNSYTTDILSNAYLNKDYKHINYILKNLIVENQFMSNYNKNIIINNFLLNFKLKRILDKCYHSWRRKKNESINKTSLNLIPVNDIDQKNKITIYDNYKIFTFHDTEIGIWIKDCLEKSEDLFIEPIYPNNPYTNKIFNDSQLLYIYNFLEKNNKLPFILSLFKESKFSMETFLQKHKSYLDYIACKNYVYEMSDNEWKEMLDEFELVYNLENRYCKQCLLKIPNYRKVFNETFIQYTLEHNIILNGKSRSYKLFINLIKYYDLKKKRNTVCTKHRKIYRYKKGFKFNLNSKSEFEKLLENKDPNLFKDFKFTANTDYIKNKFVDELVDKVLDRAVDSLKTIKNNDLTEQLSNQEKNNIQNNIVKMDVDSPSYTTTAINDTSDDSDDFDQLPENFNYIINNDNKTSTI